MIAKPFSNGVLACLMLLGAYFGVLALVSGGEYALEQFVTYWYFIVGLAVGFGVQMFNAAGVAYIASKVFKACKEHAPCAHPA